MHPVGSVTIARLAVGFWQALVGLGGLWLPLPDPSPSAEQGAVPQDPAPRHPERLCPELPAGPAELALWAQLDGLDGLDGFDGLDAWTQQPPRRRPGRTGTEKEE
ncbi:DUF6059 family protein [Kitasatospora kazusensis]|uniref:DUF6059 family protein n=1 Tax=Kitasatospora kazusensis TaxID=407974 RepID=UPI0031DE2A12